MFLTAQCCSLPWGVGTSGVRGDRGRSRNNRWEERRPTQPLGDREGVNDLTCRCWGSRGGDPGLSGPEEGCSRQRAEARKDCGGSLVSRRGRWVSEGSRRPAGRKETRGLRFLPQRAQSQAPAWGPWWFGVQPRGWGRPQRLWRGSPPPPPCCGGGARSSSPRCHGYQSSQLP